MSTLIRLSSLGTAALLLAATGSASAQPNPTFAYAKPEEASKVEAVEWTATAEAGLVLTTGNSETTTATISLF